MSAPATHRSEAACEAESAYRALVRMVLWLDAADLEVSEDVDGSIESVAYLASGLLLANDDGPLEVDRDAEAARRARREARASRRRTTSWRSAAPS